MSPLDMRPPLMITHSRSMELFSLRARLGSFGTPERRCRTTVVMIAAIEIGSSTKDSRGRTTLERKFCSSVGALRGIVDGCRIASRDRWKRHFSRFDASDLSI